MKKLYLSPFSFRSFQSVFPKLEFHVELLNSPYPGFEKVAFLYKDKCSEEFKSIENGKATVAQLLNILNKDNLYAYEYIMRSGEMQIESVTPNCTIINFADEKNLVYIKKMLELWGLYKYEKLNSLQPGTLHDIEGNEAKPIVKIENSDDPLNWDLSCYIVRELEADGLNYIEEGTELPERNRIYYY